MIVLCTGGSGFLGEMLLRRLVSAGHQVIATSRKGQPARAGVEWLEVDLTDQKSLFRSPVLASIRGVECVIHAAALYDMQAGSEDLYLQNVIATANMLQLARHMPNLRHFCHISTVAVAGDYAGVFHEDMFDVGQGFPDAYARTKFAAEHLVRSATHFKSRSCMRLGILLGDSQDGWIPKVDGPYYVQRLLKRLAPAARSLNALRFLPVPFTETSKLMVVPVDITAEAIVQLLPVACEYQELRTYHIMGPASQVSVRRFLVALCDHYGITLEPLPLPRWILPHGLAAKFNIPEDVLPYLHLPWTFASEHLVADLPHFVFPKFSDYAPILFAAADRLHFTQRKVHA